MKKDDLQKITDFIYEAGILRHTPRSGYWFLGSGQQSVAEHLFRAAIIAYALAYLTPKVDKQKVVFMALVHDFAEGRTSDLNYVHQRYGRLAETAAFEDISKAVPFGKELRDVYVEEHDRKTPEAKVVKDADTLEWIASLREEEVKGNAKAKEWIVIAIKRLKTPAGKDLGRLLAKTRPDSWWFNKADSWFVDRKESDRNMHKRKK
ncbi:MAG TPA: HD domain-containing protein [Candidatus Paceibacterota bacterium]|nr:HD domain-containing protein [Candidatus Paceibacterota bacterium]